MRYSIGLGQDIHKLFDGYPLVLGGITIDSPCGFNTHSDGDVLSHAIVNALAGAIADGNLGTWFPENDPKTADALSLSFIKKMMREVRSRGYELEHLDCFAVLGTTKLMPYLEEIRTSLAEALAVDRTFVSVKARSNDGLGLEGRGEACSAHAVVLLRSNA